MASHQMTVRHKVPGCISRQYYKSVLAGESQSEFNSLVEVLPGASKSDSQQLNRNLLLSEGASAFSRPRLRIDTDDVSANHGSATGQIEEDELFYLQSRGLSEKKARAVLVEGFAEEIAGEINEKSLKSNLETMIHRGIEELMGGIK